MPKIPSLPGPLTALEAADLFPVEEASSTTTKRVTWQTIMQAIYPVGSIYFNAAVSTNPATLLGFGTWTAYAAGRVPVGFDSGQVEFDTLGETGGAKTHTLTSAEMPIHTHSWNSGQATATAGGIGGVALNNAGFNIAGPSANAGSGGAHNNLQPYITVYMWQRTA